MSCCPLTSVETSPRNEDLEERGVCSLGQISLVGSPCSQKPRTRENSGFFTGRAKWAPLTPECVLGRVHSGLPRPPPHMCVQLWKPMACMEALLWPRRGCPGGSSSCCGMHWARFEQPGRSLTGRPPGWLGVLRQQSLGRPGLAWANRHGHQH